MELVPDIEGKDVLRNIILNEIEAINIQQELLEAKKQELQARLEALQ